VDESHRGSISGDQLVAIFKARVLLRKHPFNFRVILADPIGDSLISLAKIFANGS